MKTIRRIALLVALAIAATTVTACGPMDDPTYTPAAYYQTVGNVYECYYLTVPAEAEALKAAGLCPSGAIDTPMPLAYQETYWPYWSSAAYDDEFIPVAQRSTFVHVTVVRCNRNPSFVSGVSRYSATATYRGSNGSTVRGYSSVRTSGFTATSPRSATFGGGARSVQTYGGGSRTRQSTYVSRSAGRH